MADNLKYKHTDFIITQNSSCYGCIYSNSICTYPNKNDKLYIKSCIDIYDLKDVGIFVYSLKSLFKKL